MNTIFSNKTVFLKNGSFRFCFFKEVSKCCKPGNNLQFDLYLLFFSCNRARFINYKYSIKAQNFESFRILLAKIPIKIINDKTRSFIGWFSLPKYQYGIRITVPPSSNLNIKYLIEIFTN